MDPLSVIASCIAIGTLVWQTGQAIADLRTLTGELPQRLWAVKNEVNDIGLVVSQVQEFVERRKRFQSLVFEAADCNVLELLEKAQINLTTLQIIVSGLAVLCSKEGNWVGFFRARAWKQKHSEIERVQKEVTSIKSSLSIVLQASNSCDTMDIRFDLQSLTTITSSISDGQDRLRQDLISSLSILPNTALRMLEAKVEIEGLFQKHAEQIEAKTTELLMDQNDRLDPLIRRTPPKIRRQRQPQRPQKSRSSSSSQSRNTTTTTQTEGVAIQVAQYASACQPTCICSCHMQIKAPAPAFINRVLGQLFVGAAGVPLLSQKCDSQTCKSSKVPRVSVEYWFPLGVFWSQIIRLQVGYHASTGPQVSLKSLRRVPDSAQCVHYAMTGNIEGLKDLFNRGLASPWDVSSTRGYTLSRWALYSKQYKATKFLTWAGSDPDYRPIAKTDNSTRNKAFDNLLQGGLDKEAEEDIRCLTASSDWIEEQNFTRLHKIILQLLPLPLEQIIAEAPEELDMTDAMGRTPLLWAAARGDHKSIQLLLEHNADPNIIDIYLAPPVSYAADINAESITQHTPLTTAITYNSHEVLRLLLERWEEFSACPRLKGPQLLEITALYADVATIKLLAGADHLKLKYDPNYSLRDFVKRLTERVDVTKELIDAFDELLLVLSEGPKRLESRESLMEKGFHSHPSPLATMYESEMLAADIRRSNEGLPSTYSDESDEKAEFEDAVEDLDTLNSESRDFSSLRLLVLRFLSWMGTAGLDRAILPALGIAIAIFTI